ncbi:Dabb family protein (plasmid) [Rhizobium sp. RCAM05350]|uniref:Dabb family protein n=1 Tax=Rhizobium sp. RCAM05350 TaxID=2895568 RepID=UPI00207685AC|nr:Dabb family protein [Rhizobium sp. RCAM05350]URK89526.1 Dabb family protein [Rhizobium sp. RCAM05350]
MIRHFVLLRFKDDVSSETKLSIYEELEALKHHVGGILAFHAGPNVSVETDLIRGFKDVFWFDFEDEAARDAYIVEPRHQAVGARIVAHTENGSDGVVVVDVKV